MTMQQSLAATTSDEIYLLLRHEILRGALQGGTKLTASELRDRYGFGLTPIREALLRLSAEGLTVSERNRGVRIRDVSRAELGDLTLARKAIEMDILPRSIALGDETWEAGVVSSLHLLMRTPLPGPNDDQAYSKWEDRHRAFHHSLVAACGSDWLLHFWNVLADHSERFRKLRFQKSAGNLLYPPNVNEAHERIAQAALERDAVKACALMDDHLEQTRRSADMTLAALGYG